MRNESRVRTRAEGTERNWKYLPARVLRRVSKDRLVLVAAGVTFYILLAIFPVIAALVAIYGLFGDPNTAGRDLDALSGVLPQGGINVLREQARHLTEQPSSTLGSAFFVGLVVSLWSANSGMKAIFDALNAAYEREERRGFLKRNLLSLLFTLILLAFVLFALAVVVILPYAMRALNLGTFWSATIEIANWLVLLALIDSLFSALYHYGPCRHAEPRRWITWGSSLATVLWLSASLLFSWYTSNFGSYDRTYGTLGAAVGFMTWIWLSTVAVLLGAVLDAELERRAEQGSIVAE